MSRQSGLFSLSEEHRMALEAICRRRKVDALVWKRARAFILLDAGYDARTICEILDIGPSVLTEWRLALATRGCVFFGLKDYSQRQGHLSCAQEAGPCRHFTDTPSRTIDEVRSHIAHEYEKSCSRPGAAKLMCRPGFAYKKPVSLPARADEAEQKAFIADYEALMTGQGGDEMVVFSGAVHPTHQTAPPMAGFSRTRKPPSNTNLPGR